MFSSLFFFFSLIYLCASVVNSACEWIFFFFMWFDCKSDSVPYSSSCGLFRYFASDDQLSNIMVNTESMLKHSKFLLLQKCRFFFLINKLCLFIILKVQKLYSLYFMGRAFSKFMLPFCLKIYGVSYWKVSGR